MLSLALAVALGGLLGASFGYFGCCASATCRLTSNWWRAALCGAALAAFVSLSSGGGSVRFGKTGLESPHVIHLAQSDFDSRVLAAAHPVLVDFYAPWCESCKRVAPTFNKLADQFVGRALFMKVNVEEAAPISERYNIEGLPTLLLFDRGKVVGGIAGPASETELRELLEKTLPRAAVSTIPPPGT